MKPIVIEIVIPSLNAAAELPDTLAALRSGCGGVVIAAIHVVEAGDADAAQKAASAHGATVATCGKGRGHQILHGVSKVSSPWIFVCHADSRIGEAWGDRLMEKVARHGEDFAYYASLRFADVSPLARFVEWGVAARCRLQRLPYGDQGLILSRRLHDAVGGYRDWPLFEDVAMAEAIGAHRLRPLGVPMLTSARRYKTRGYVRQVLANRRLLAAYRRGVDPVRLAHFYETGHRP